MPDASNNFNAALTVANIKELFTQHQKLVILSTSFSAFFSLFYPVLSRNYQAFKDLGQGGLPRNVFGWAFVSLIKPFERDTLSTAVYDQRGPESWLGDPELLPVRQGLRPKTGWHPVPHRQIDQFPPEEIKMRLDQLFLKVAVDNVALVEVAASRAEKMHAGLFVRGSSAHPAAAHAGKEIGHLHANIDYSMHLALSPRDCKSVIEHGWGERHPFAGTSVVAVENLLIYAPRNEEELAVVERILKASIGFMTDSREVV